MSVSRFRGVGQGSQERPDRLGHVGLLPVVPDGAVAVMDLELVAELVRSARSAHAGGDGVRGQERGDEVLLIRGQVGGVEARDHVQAREAATSDQSQVHEPTVTPVTLDVRRTAGRWGSLNEPRP